MGNQLPLCKDASLDAQLNEEGYIIVPFLDAGEVAAITEYFRKIHPDPVASFYASTHVPDVAFRKEVNDFIKPYFVKGAEKYLQNCAVQGGGFIAKGSGEGTSIHPHQDWNIVDEREGRSFNIWLPLCDTDKDNGGIWILPQSHKATFNFRGPNFSGGLDNILQEVWPHMQELKIPAGHALIYDHRLMHASSDNMSGKERIGIVFGMMPHGQEMYYYYKEENAEGKAVLGQYRSNVNFFLEQEIHAGPGPLKKVGEIEYDFPDYSLADFERIFLGKERAKAAAPVEEPQPEIGDTQLQATENQGIWQRIKGLFN